MSVLQDKQAVRRLEESLAPNACSDRPPRPDLRTSLVAVTSPFQGESGAAFNSALTSVLRLEGTEARCAVMCLWKSSDIGAGSLLRVPQLFDVRDCQAGDLPAEVRSSRMRRRRSHQTVLSPVWRVPVEPQERQKWHQHHG